MNIQIYQVYFITCYLFYLPFHTLIFYFQTWFKSKVVQMSHLKYKHYETYFLIAFLGEQVNTNIWISQSTNKYKPKKSTAWMNNKSLSNWTKAKRPANRLLSVCCTFYKAGIFTPILVRKKIKHTLDELLASLQKCAWSSTELQLQQEIIIIY